jgi:hypothetical protein
MILPGLRSAIAFVQQGESSLHSLAWKLPSSEVQDSPMAKQTLKELGEGVGFLLFSYQPQVWGPPQEYFS